MRMIRRTITTVFLLSLIHIHGVAGPASAQDGSSLFALGRNAFQAKEYGQALAYFRQAEEAGNRKMALYYNIGVCAYKEGLLDLARSSFLKVSQSPKMAAIANYNLGLICLREDNPEAARAHFTTALQLAKDEKSRLLAQAGLAKTGQNNEPQSLATLKYFSFGLGYDDNVLLTSDTDTIAASDSNDSFSEVLFFMKKYLGQSSYSKQLRVQGSIYSLKYFDLNEYDIGSGNMGLFYRTPFRTWQFESGLDYTYTLQDNTKFEQIPTANLQLKKYIAENTYLQLRYRLSYFDMLDPDYDYLSGWRQRYEAKCVSFLDALRLAAEYRFEHNDRDNDDYSYLRHRFRLAANYTLNNTWELGASVSLRKSETDYAAGQHRKDDRIISKASLLYNISKNWVATLDYQYTDNDSNLDSNDYHRNLLTLSLSTSF